VFFGQLTKSGAVVGRYADSHQESVMLPLPRAAHVYHHVDPSTGPVRPISRLVPARFLQHEFGWLRYDFEIAHIHRLAT
jgi:hypothetical protein